MVGKYHMSRHRLKYSRSVSRTREGTSEEGQTGLGGDDVSVKLMECTT